MNSNDLLLWLSAQGSGTWDRYRTAIDEALVADDEGVAEELQEDRGQGGYTNLPLHHRLRLNLERLGHAEFFRINFENGWHVVPPILACETKNGKAVGVLCGARTDRLMHSLVDNIADLEIAFTQQTEGPDRVLIVADKTSRLEDLADSVGLNCQQDAIRLLLAALPPIDDAQLRITAEIPFGRDWDVGRFSATSLTWTPVSPIEARSAPFGLFRFRVHHRNVYYLRLSGQTYQVSGQVGKYFVLKKRRRRVLSYVAESQVLTVPVWCRPPLLLDRALTLCSGLLPCVDHGCLVYTNVSQSIALTVTAILRQ